MVKQLEKIIDDISKVVLPEPATEEDRIAKEAIEKVLNEVFFILRKENKNIDDFITYL